MFGTRISRLICAAAVTVAVAGGAYAQHSTGPIAGMDPVNPGDFNDVKSPPLATSQEHNTTWMIHIDSIATNPPTLGIQNYAGFLFDLQYDGEEMSFISLLPTGPHSGIEQPFGPITNTVSFNGSNNIMNTVEPLAVWVPQAIAQASGTVVDNSQVLSLFHVRLHAKNTSTANNSDIDVRISQLGVIRHNTQAGVVVTLQASDWVYVSGNFPGAPFAQYGEGEWVHVSDTGVFSVPPSAFYATNASKGPNAGLGIEHVPEPASIGLLIGGGLLLAVGRLRRRAA